MLTSNNSVSLTPNENITSFSSILPDYKNVLRAPFREWAENALPGEYEKIIMVFIGVTKQIFQSIHRIWRDPPILATKSMRSN
jgi:hypothetical protein